MACLSSFRGWVQAEYPDVTADVLRRLSIAGLYRLANIIGGFKWYCEASAANGSLMALEVPEGFRVLTVERVEDDKGCIPHKQLCASCTYMRTYDAENGTVVLHNGSFIGHPRATYRLQVKAGAAPQDIPDDLYDAVAPIVAEYIKAKLALEDKHNRSARRIGEDFMMAFERGANAYKRELSMNGRNEEYTFKGVHL